MDSYRIPALVLVTSASEEPVSLDEAKLWLKTDTDDTADDDLVTSLIATARAKYEEYTHRCLLKQTFDAIPEDVPCGPVTLPRSPVVSVSSIKGFTDTDLDNTVGTAMSSSGYYVDTLNEPGRVVPVGDATWPVGTRRLNPIAIRFIAGYSSQTSGVPEQAKTEIKQLVARAYEHRGDEVAAVRAMDELLRESDLALPDWG